MKAAVAYEAPRRARELRWHKRPGGLYAVGGEGRHYGIRQAERVNRAKGVYKWLLTLGGPDPAKEAVVTIQSADSLTELKAFASVHNRKAPSPEAREGRGEHDTMIPPPIPTMPASGHTPISSYATSVQERLDKMGSPTPFEDVRGSAGYLQDCERGGISPEVAAAVILATLHHGHIAPGPKHAEFALESSRKRATKGQFWRNPHSDTIYEIVEVDPNGETYVVKDTVNGDVSRVQGWHLTKYGWQEMAANEARSPTGAEWEVIVMNPPAAHRGAILNMALPGEGEAVGDRIILGGFFDDDEANHVARAITKRYRVPVTIGPRRALETAQEGARRRPFDDDAASCGCKPFTQVTKDPTLYEACKKRADAIGAVTTPRAIYDLVAPDLTSLTHEEFVVLGLGTRGDFEGKVMTYARVAHGDQHEVKVYIEQISQILLADRPDIYVIAHNHPGGDATPSEQDEKLTAGIVEGLKKTCPRIVYGDHLVIASKEFYSFREKKKTKIR